MTVNKAPTLLKENYTSEDLISVNSCGICGGDLTPVEVYSQKPFINFVKCKCCGAITYDKICKQEKLDEIYNESDYYDNQNDEGVSVTFFGTERFAKHIYKYCRPKEKKDVLKILDFGGGDGTIAYEVSKLALKNKNCNKVEVTVVDYCAKTRDSSENADITINKVFPLASVEDDKQYDIVIASAVLEHLPTPKNEIKKLFSSLALGGAMYCRTPYIFPLYCILKKVGIDYSTKYPNHIFDLGSAWYKNLTKVFNCQDEIKLIISRPSIAEGSFCVHFFAALISRAMKAIWYICHKWQFVGGWEAVWRKDAEKDAEK